MITIDSYNLYYNTQHLLSPKPQTYEEIINRLIPLECKLFYNIISSPNCRYEKRFAENRISNHFKNMDAESRFKNIFKEKKIYANPKSFFVNKLVSVPPKDCTEIKSVSFTLCDYKDLPKHFVARDSEYGICFFHDFLQNRGLRPVEYLNEIDIEKSKKLVFNSPHLLEVCSELYDMKWENEWRIGNDLDFTEDDIAFVIVPFNRHAYFLDWFQKTDYFPNIQIITSETYKSFIDHLILYPQQKDNNWNQIELFRTKKTGKGMHINPEEFNTLDYTSRALFSIDHDEELNCLAKNTILMNYEYAYTNKFIRFADKFNSSESQNSLFNDLDLIKSNKDESLDSQRDLIIALFESLYEDYPLYTD